MILAAAALQRYSQQQRCPKLGMVIGHHVAPLESRHQNLDDVVAEHSLIDRPFNYRTTVLAEAIGPINTVTVPVCGSMKVTVDSKPSESPEPSIPIVKKNKGSSWKICG